MYRAQEQNENTEPHVQKLRIKNFGLGALLNGRVCPRFNAKYSKNNEIK
jgi:hypothetical protein